jgi:hypothetical protein
MRFTIIFNKFVRKANEPFREPIMEIKTFNHFNKVIEYSRDKHINTRVENYYIRREPYQIILYDGSVLKWSDFTKY